jgi:AcrR family transcriptional regulator
MLSKSSVLKVSVRSKKHIHEDKVMRGQVDLRVRRTRTNLREALIDLIEEKGFDAVTVGDIAE